ncbi:hypothetical protein AnigIFM59636_011270 [Aspergillus niger]|nr:hypothetical protein AnigIFM59636_011270 [Aspergillus niger]
MSSLDSTESTLAEVKQLTILGREDSLLQTDAEDSDARLALGMECLLGKEESVRDLLAKRRRVRTMDGSTGWAEQLSIALDYKNALSSIVPFKEYQKRISKTIGGRTPLSCAAEGGNPKIVRMLLEDGEDVNERDADRSNGVPLHYAVYDESLEAFELLLQQKVDIEATNIDGHTTLAVAARYYQSAAVDVLLDKCKPNVNPKDVHGYTPLLLLLMPRPTIHMEARQGSNGRTALNIAAARGSIEDMVLLLENGADVNISSAEGLTALDLAAIQGNLEMVTLLLDHNAKVDTLGIRKTTPLDQDRPRIIELLLQRKPDLLLHKSASNLLMEEVTTMGMAVCLGTPEMVRVLLRYPGSDAKQSVLRMPLLCWAAVQSKADMVETLIQQGVSLQEVDGRYGRNALSWAVIKGKQDIVTRLLQTPGVGWDDVDQQGRSALFHAAVTGNEEMFEELRSRGSAVHRPDQFGFIPLFVAVQHGRESLVRRILGDHPLTQEPRDGSGRSLSWWIRSTGNDALRETIVGYGMQLGGQVLIEESHSYLRYESSRSSQDCDICTLPLNRDNRGIECGSGCRKYRICHICSQFGASCKDFAE